MCYTLYITYLHGEYEVYGKGAYTYYLFCVIISSKQPKGQQCKGEYMYYPFHSTMTDDLDSEEYMYYPSSKVSNRSGGVHVLPSNYKEIWGVVRVLPTLACIPYIK